MEDPTDEGLRRDVGFFGMLWISAGTTLGSGWLFGAFVAVTIAGPAALIAWLLGSLFMAPIALVYAELGGMFPESGGPGRFANHAFGSLAGATFGWFSYIQAATIAPIEVLAAIEYLSTNSWATGLYNAGSGTLSSSGYVVAVVFMGVFVTLNLLGIRLLSRANSAITVFKLAIPSLAALALIVADFHLHNFTAAGGFFVHTDGGPTHAILSAITAGGIAFALMGFEGALEVGGESTNPRRDLPRAVFGAFLGCTAIYIAVQVAFIAALPPSLLSHYTSWTELATDPQLSRAPFFVLASLIGLVWLAWIMRVDAVISPSGTGLLYLTGASRLSFGLSRDGYVPRLFLVEDERSDVPLWGVIMSGALGLLFLLPFPSWSKLVSVVTGAVVLMYAAAPLALGSLRRSRPEMNRPYRLPAAGLLSPLSFVFATFIAYWSGWQTISTLMIALLLGYGLMGVARSLHLDLDPPRIEWAAARWLFPYLIGLSVVSYLGDFGTGAILGGVGPFRHVLVGGHGVIPLWWDMACLAVLSLVIYAGAMAQGATVDPAAPPASRSDT
ncbi:MAG: APC family permease [Acidimicrobiales bacterium]|jgi:amino acid transporter